MDTAMLSTSIESIELTDSKEAEQDFKAIVRTIKRQLTASESFNQFIQLSSSHGAIMQQNLQSVQSILLQIVLNLLSSFKFKFVTTVECNGFGRRPLFTEMIHQMDKFKMHDYPHWSQIIAEAKKNIDKFINKNQAKYEDLVQFIHLTLSHIAKANIRLDCESFAILFNTQLTSNMPPVQGLDLTPFVPKASYPVPEEPNNGQPKPKNGNKSVSRSATSSYSHKRKLNFEIEYKLKPIDISPIKYYRRPDNYKAIVIPETRPIPLESKAPTMDPRSIHMFKRTPKPIEPRRLLGRITVHIGSGDQQEISRPSKRTRIVWDLP